MDDSLTQTVDNVDGDCTKFRILLLGKAGCGKSSLLKKVFGIEAAIVSRQDPGSAEIEREVTFPQNSRIVLHDSKGFLPDSESEFNILKDFIQERMNKPKLKDRLHAVWICMSTPHGGERLDQTGVEKIFNLIHNKLPLIIVLTKFDLLFATTLSNMGDKDVDELWADSRVKATHELNELLKHAPHNLRQLVVTVSTSPKFEDTIPALIKLLCAEVQRFPGIRTYNQPASLMWSIAQRGDVDTTIAATIRIGRKRYWSGLGSGINFATKTLEECLSTIHADIVTIWNIQDNSNYLAGDDFKARMTHLVDDLASSNPNDSCATPTPVNIVANLVDAPVHSVGIAIAVIGAADEAAKWVYDVYERTPQNIACVMGYIVDLTIIMRLLSISHWSATYTSGAIEEETVDAIREHVSSGNLSKVHNKIRKFVNENILWFIDGRDIVLEEIVHLIQEFCDISQLPTVSSEYDLSPRSSINVAQKHGENVLRDMLQEGQLEAAVSQEYDIVTKDGNYHTSYSALPSLIPTKPTIMSTVEAAVTTSMRHPVAKVRNEEDPESQTLSIPLTSEPQPMQRRSNVVLFGEVGVGKSSVVNLIMGLDHDVAKISSGTSNCTLNTRHYDVTIRGRDFRIFDTIGLNEPQSLRDSDRLIGAINNAYRLVRFLSDTGGINLLVFCIRRGRITTNMQQNYMLFHDFLCQKKVPVALVITHLEHEEKMEDWWLYNNPHFTECGIQTVGHACITAKREFSDRYEASRQAVHDLLVAHGRGAGFTQERVSWVAELSQKLLDSVHPRIDSIKVRTQKLREYGLREEEIPVLLAKITAMDENIAVVKPLRPHVFQTLLRGRLGSTRM